MKSENMRSFDEVYMQQDEAEADLINAKYDQNIADPEFAGNALHAAIEDVDDDLGEIMPNQYPYGYEITKKAHRWWNYRNAYLQDVKPDYDEYDKQAEGDPWQFGLEDAYVSFEEKFMALTHQQVEAGQKLIQGDRFYLRLYAYLEDQRIQHRHDDIFLHNPLAMEESASYDLLRSTMDEVLDARGQPLLGRQVYSSFADRDETLQSFTVTREKIEDEVIYSINLFEVLDPDSASANGEINPTVTYYLIVGKDGAVDVSGQSHLGPPDIDTYLMLDLADLITDDEGK